MLAAQTSVIWEEDDGLVVAGGFDFGSVGLLALP